MLRAVSLLLLIGCLLARGAPHARLPPAVADALPQLAALAADLRETMQRRPVVTCLPIALPGDPAGADDAGNPPTCAGLAEQTGMAP